jgi:two-component system response regulator FlrC
VRELANVLERSAILADGEEIGADDLSLLVEAPPPEAPAAAGSVGTMEDVERQAIERALAATGGNRRRAATMLGIGLRTLYEKLKRYGL